jgi:hypothetical protein
MKISNMASSPISKSTISTSNAATEQRPLTEDNVDPAKTTKRADPATQDASVKISPESAAMAVRETNSEQGSPVSLGNSSRSSKEEETVRYIERPPLNRKNSMRNTANDLGDS